MCIYIYIYICICMCIYIKIYIYIYLYIYIYIHTHMYMNTYIYLKINFFLFSQGGMLRPVRRRRKFYFGTRGYFGRRDYFGMRRLRLPGLVGRVRFASQNRHFRRAAILFFQMCVYVYVYIYNGVRTPDTYILVFFVFLAD